jgi:hypothetical protein
MRLESVVVGNSRSINAIYTDEYGKIVSMPIVVKIPDNFQAFVDEGGEKLTGNPNLLSLREESGVGANDQKRGKLGGTYKIDVLEENIPAFKSAVTLAKVDSIIEKELDDDSYWITSPYSDMKDTAEQVFAAMGFEDYTISEDGDNILISVEGYDIPAFDTKKNENRDHSKRRGEFKRHLSDIYTALTTGKKVGGSGGGKPAGNKLLYPDWKKQNPNGTQDEYLRYFNS